MNNKKSANTFIEWDTVRGRGDFDAGYVNEFQCFNENGEIDDQKKKEFEENPQYQVIKKHKSCICSHHQSHKSRSKLKAIKSDTQVIKKTKSARTVKLSPNKQPSPGSESKTDQQMDIYFFQRDRISTVNIF